MDNVWTRRKLLSRAAYSAASLSFTSPARGALASAATKSALRGRFVTHVSVVRVNQIEVTPTRSIGEDEVPDNRPDHIRSRREAFSLRVPGWQNDMGDQLAGAAMTPGKQYKDARRLLVSYHERYGDEITFIPGGYFAPMYDTREHNR